MLSKVNSYNWNLGTNDIKTYVETFPSQPFETIYDNQNGCLLILLKNKEMFLWNMKEYKKIYGISRLRIFILNRYFWKQIDSFDQNNIMIANKIRKYVIQQFIPSKTNTIVGIGGEYYIYFPFIKGKEYIGISNHLSIIEDANFNSKFYIDSYSHHFVNYNEMNTFPILDDSKKYSIIMNVSSIHQNQMEWIKDMNIERFVIITCKSYRSKLRFLLKYFDMIDIKHFQNKNGDFREKMSGQVSVLTFTKKNTFISLGSNCSVTYHLNQFHLRKKSYPFDWSRIHINQLIRVLEDDFSLYQQIEYTHLSELFLNTESKPTLLLKNSYGIQFAHEICSTNMEEIECFKQKLHRRIERFRNLKKSGNKVTFVRIEMNRINIGYFTKLMYLIELLEKYVIHFECIIILHCPNEILIHHPKIRYYTFDSFSSDWKMEHLDWKRFLFF